MSRIAVPSRADEASPRTLRVSSANLILAASVVLVGSCVALWNLDRGLWLDEFITLARTDSALTPSQFWRLMTKEQHPIAHYGLIYLARTLGLDGVGALRMLNLLGVAWVMLALTGAVRQRVLSTAQACVIAALYASSKAFFVYLVELRGYHLCYAGSIALSCAWLALRSESASPRSLARWGVTLLLFTNTHYYALLFSGILTVFLLVRPPRPWSHGGLLRIAGSSLLAALPAVAMWSLQAHETLTGKYFKYVSAGLGASIRMSGHLFFDVTGFNLPAYVLVALTLLALRRRVGGIPAQFLALAGAAAATYGVLLVANACVPLLRPRYLVAAGAGAITVVVGGLAAWRDPSLARTAPIYAFALAVQLLVPRLDWYAPPYWKKSAEMVAEATRACPSTTVYAATEVHPDVQQRPDAPPLWLTGYRHYAQQLGFSVTPLTRGAWVRPGEGCPSIIWMEHIQRFVGAPVEQLLSGLQLGVAGKVRVRYADSGAVLWVE